MRRGDVFWVNLDPVVGSEVGKKRPAVVVQNEAANHSSTTVTIIPLSTSVGRVYPFQVRIPAGEAGLDRESKALCEQIRTVSRTRLLAQMGTLDQGRLAEIHKAVDRHLWL
jgi:mRNA interferase MazF